MIKHVIIIYALLVGVGFASPAPLFSNLANLTNGENQMIKEKKCSVCGELKLLKKFYSDRSKKLGVSSACRECKAMQRKNPSFKIRKNEYIHKENNITELIIYSRTYGRLIALIDTDDYQRIKQHQWAVTKNGNCYYIHFNKTINGKYKKVYLHRFILNEPNNLYVDHQNMETFDNRKFNLRACTHRQNLLNNKKHNFKGRKMTSQYKGVAKNKNRWVVFYRLNGKTTYGGIFKSEIEAAIRFNELAKKHYGKFARLNEF